MSISRRVLESFGDPLAELVFEILRSASDRGFVLDALVAILQAQGVSASGQDVEEALRTLGRGDAAERELRGSRYYYYARRMGFHPS